MLTGVTGVVELCENKSNVSVPQHALIEQKKRERETEKQGTVLFMDISKSAQAHRSNFGEEHVL